MDWPFVSRKKHDQALVAQLKDHHESLVERDHQHASELLALQKRVDEIAAQRNRDADDYQRAVQYHVAKERERCLNIVESAPSSGRAAFVRDWIMVRIQPDASTNATTTTRTPSEGTNAAPGPIRVGPTII